MQTAEARPTKRKYRKRKSIDRRMMIAVHHMRAGLTQTEAIAIAGVPKETFRRRRQLAIQLQTLGDY